MSFNTLSDTQTISYQQTLADYQKTDTNSCFQDLSDSNLVSCFENLVRSERKITAQVLECIGEIDKRKLFLEKGYTSLFDYLVKDFGYSPGAAMRRIDGARLLNELPEISEKFESGILTLSQATQVQRASRELKKTKNKTINSAQKRELLSQIENLNQKETEQTLADLLNLPVMPVQKEVVHKNHSVTLTITFSAEQIQILEQAQNMISHSVPHKSWADTLTYLAQKEISRRTSIRLEKTITAATAVEKQSNKKKIAEKTFQANHATQTNHANPTNHAIQDKYDIQTNHTNLNNHAIQYNYAIQTNHANRTNFTTRANYAIQNNYATQTDQSTHSPNQRNTFKRRAIATRVRKKLIHPLAVCEHKDSKGRRCLNTRFLQIDHIQSLSRGGTNHLDNLQVLCGVHNRLKYQRESREALLREEA